MKVFITHNLQRIPKELKDLSDITVKKAAARAVKETATKLRKDLSMEVRKRVNLPASGTSRGGRGLVPPGVKDLIVVDAKVKANRSTPLSSIFAHIRTSNKPISLIHFVRGKKEPANQKGIPVKRRKKLKVQIMRGKTETRPHSFIQRAKGNIQVFNRGSGRNIKKQSVPSVFEFLKKPGVLNPFLDNAGQYYQTRLIQNLKFFGGKTERKK